MVTYSIVFEGKFQDDASDLGKDGSVKGFFATRILEAASATAGIAAGLELIRSELASESEYLTNRLTELDATDLAMLDTNDRKVERINGFTFY